ncbi:uncharacterized protein [Argopecten irradians]|uniref:uncharacterized protein n=1 Tax=Argopecten irradians TaxID=31199 RepID=UPI00371E5C53
MAPKRKATRNHPYDATNPANWTVKQMREELAKKGIVVNHTSISRVALLQMCKDNGVNVVSTHGAPPAQSPSSESSRITGQRDNTSDVNLDLNHRVNVNTIRLSSSRIPRPVISMPERDVLSFDAEPIPTVELEPTVSEAARTVDPRPCHIPATRSDTVTSSNMAAPSETLLERTLSLMEMTFKVIQSTHTKPTEPAFDMESAYNNLRRIRSGEACERLSGSSLETIRHHADLDGVPADLLPQIDIVSPNLRQKIIQGVPESGTSSKHTSMSLPRVFAHNVELQQTVNKLWEAATTQGTREAYNTGFTSYKTFLSLNGINWVFSMPPVSEDPYKFCCTKQRTVQTCL